MRCYGPLGKRLGCMRGCARLWKIDLCAAYETFPPLRVLSINSPFT